MSDENLDERIKKLLQKLEEASVLNGGFDKLSSDISELKDSQSKIAFDLQKISESDMVQDGKLQDIRAALYEPDKGLFKRINYLSYKLENLETFIQETKKEIEALELAIRPIEKTTGLLVDIAGDNLSELSRAIQTRKKSEKLWWAMLTAAFGGTIKLAYDLISNIL